MSGREGRDGGCCCEGEGEREQAAYPIARSSQGAHVWRR